MYFLLVKLQSIQNEENKKIKLGRFRRSVLRRSVRFSLVKPKIDYTID